MTDHEIREAINELHDIAVKYHDAQQLRECIAGVVVKLLKPYTQPDTHVRSRRKFIEDMTDIGKEQFLVALEKWDGCFSLAAKDVGISRQCAYLWEHKDYAFRRKVHVILEKCKYAKRIQPVL